MFASLVLVLAALLVIDWRQTLRIARNPNRWYERNPLLGRHPSAARVHAHFTGSCALIAAGLHFLPAPFAWALGAVMLVLEGICVVNNFRHGIKP